MKIDLTTSDIETIFTALSFVSVKAYELGMKEDHIKYEKVLKTVLSELTKKRKR